MSEHTPTPWRAEPPREFAGVKWDKIIRGKNNDPVCTVIFAGYMAKQAEANAALIVHAVNSIDRITAERDAAILERDETHTNLNDRIADLGAEVDQATKTIGRIWKALGIETYLDANGKEISECVAELKTERDAARAALKLISTQCGNVIFNCTQVPSGNERHLRSWETVKACADTALGSKKCVPSDDGVSAA